MNPFVWGAMIVLPDAIFQKVYAHQNPDKKVIVSYVIPAWMGVHSGKDPKELAVSRKLDKIINGTVDRDGYQVYTWLYSKALSTIHSKQKTNELFFFGLFVALCSLYL